HLAQAHRRFPHAAALSFPSAQHPWGVQNGYVQSLADLGIVGFLLFVGLFVSGLVVAGKQALRAAAENAGPALVSIVWILGAMGFGGAVGLSAGTPRDALRWRGLGRAAAAAGGTARAAV